MHRHFDREFLLQRARQARRLADVVVDENVRGRLLDVAADYEETARRLATKSDPQPNVAAAKPRDLAERIARRRFNH
jgi:hypothetical protein